MSEATSELRNIALLAHGGAGKTSLAEAILFKAGTTNRIGRVEDGTTVMDFEPEELKRNASISSGFCQYVWKKHTVNLIDTPGDQNFFSDTKLSMQGADAGVLLVDAVDGVKVQTEQAWDFADELNLPCIIFINKLDRERADFSRTLQDISSCLDLKPITLHLPIGKEDDFKGIVDLVSMKSYIYDEDGKVTRGDIPADMQDQVDSEKEKLIEDVAEADDELIERYLEGETLSDEDIRSALRKGVISRVFVPVLCGAAIKNIGIDIFMDAINSVMPSPEDKESRTGIDPKDDSTIERSANPDEPFSAIVIKTIADPYAGRLSIFKVISGTLGPEGNFYNSTKEVKERYNQLSAIFGKEQKPATGAGPGSIVAVAKLKETITGDTLCDESGKIRYACAEPLPTLISFALQPKSKGDEDLKSSVPFPSCLKRIRP